ncbi:MAG: stage II sporulation protein M [Candidatus Bathyarchaeia archaeon]
MAGLNFLKGYPSKIKRILTIAIFLFLCFLVTAIGVLSPLSREEADTLSKEIEELRQNVNVQLIFGNNFMICLAMFVPIAGPVLGFYALYNTGVLIAADSIAHDVSPLVGFLSYLILPIIWLEFLAYSTALAESVWLILRVVQRRIRREAVNACVLISICAIILLASAFIEMALIMLLK